MEKINNEKETSGTGCSSSSSRKRKNNQCQRNNHDAGCSSSKKKKITQHHGEKENKDPAKKTPKTKKKWAKIGNTPSKCCNKKGIITKRTFYKSAAGQCDLLCPLLKTLKGCEFMCHFHLCFTAFGGSQDQCNAQCPTQPEPEPTTPDPVQYTLTVNTLGGGTVSNEGGTYDEGSEISLTASPNEGYLVFRVVRW